MKIFIFAGFILCQHAIAGFPQAKLPFPVNRHVLSNGVTVLLAQTRVLPIVAIQTWLKTGSSHETTPEQHGLAHLFEHLTYTGTPSHPEQSYDVLIEGAGGNNNAFTSRDYTEFHVNIRSDQLHRVIDLEFDRLKNVELTPQKVNKEIAIVLEERKETLENDFESTIYQKVWETVFPESSYAHPTIGSQKSVSELSLKSVKEWWTTHFVGQNLVIVIAGDFETAKVLKQLEATFGTIPSGKGTTQTSAIVQPSPSGRKEQIKWATQSYSIAIGFPTVPANHPDTYALDILSSIMHETPACPLYKHFIQKMNFASHIEGSHASAQKVGVFHSHVTLHPGIDADTGILHYQDVLNQLLEQKSFAADLKRAKSMILLEYENQTESVQSVGTMLALNELLMGSFTHWTDDIAKYLSVTQEDLKSMMKKYLSWNNASVVVAGPDQ